MASLTGDQAPSLRNRLVALLGEPGNPLAETATVVRDARAVLEQEKPDGDDIAWMYDRASAAAPRRPREALIWARITQDACRHRIGLLGRISGRRELRDLRRWTASARVFEGRLLVMLGSPAAALSVLDGVVDGKEADGVDAPLRLRAEFYLVRAHADLGHAVEADALGGRLAASLVEQGDVALAADTLTLVAGAHHRRGDDERAATLLADAAGWAERSGRRETRGRVALATAQVAAARGDAALAAEQIDLARSAAAGTGDASQQGQVEEVAARFLAGQRRFDDAARIAERAQSLHELAGEETLGLRCELLRAQVQRLQGDVAASRTHLLTLGPRITASGNAELIVALEAERAATD